MADIFLSYAREDEARAAVVARVLGEFGWSVFWDRRIIAGTSWDEVVERELQACRCVVVLWSAASITSRWVKTEARAALERSTLVPANLDRSVPPLEFRFLESAQLHTWRGATDDAEFSVLTEGIAQHVKPARREPNVEPIAAPTAAPKRERPATVPASTSGVAVVDEAPRVGDSGARSNFTDYAPELAPRRSWPSRLGKQWIPIASAAGVLVVAASIYLPTRTGTQVTDTPAPTPANATTPASPTPRPVPFGAPLRFRTDMWSLPDEPLLGFVEIPAGQFTMGGDRPEDDGPQHKVDLPRYYIGRYEVTVAQFRAFVQASGYQARTTQAQDGQTDLPVVNVSWHDAVAYATWLDKSLRESSTTPAGVRSILSAGGQPCRVTLPSEAEWEKAARGFDARVYPWGGQFDPAKANTASSGKRAPSPVGSYPDGASPYGVLDLSGNMREWTRSLWGSNVNEADFGYPYDSNDSQRENMKAPDTVFRVVRGGSYDNHDDYVRAAYRSRYVPDYRFNSFGFRVVVSCSRA
jgi:formylglycine-generating enzyme required for sulfatase activity